MNDTSDSLHISILTTIPELGSWLCEDVGCETEGYLQIATVSDRKLAFSVASTPEQVRQAPASSVSVIVIRFVDVLSLQNTLELMESRSGLKPAVVLIYRNENESDFKMSCPYCGQKLWVRDADQDKRGRCPHCHKGFTLPAQEEHVVSSLSLSTVTPVRRIVRGDPGSLASPLHLMMEADSAATTLENLGSDSLNKNETMKVDVEG
jgi:hypothetical protein